jgi:hypothetical protein
MFPNLGELEQRDLKFIFQYTVLGYPRFLDRRGPSMQKSLANFQDLARLIAPERIVWRYDPIVLTPKTDIDYHLANFDHIARALKGSTYRCVVSLVDIYRKAKGRLNQVEKSGGGIIQIDSGIESSLERLMTGLRASANRNGMELFSCVESPELSSTGIKPGKCIDDVYLTETFGIPVSSKKDPGQRKACGCVVSKDIGMYDSCLLGCQYCYATSSFKRAKSNYIRHDPTSPSLVGRHDPDAQAE